MDQPLVDGYAALAFNPKDYTALSEIPLITKGCDSQYAINSAFSHMWEKLSVDELATSLVELLPNHQWVYPSGLPVILSLTGGEPTLRAKIIPELLNHPLMKDCQHVLIETNCSVPLSWNFVGAVNEWLHADHHRQWTWSNSPKLSASGEPWNKAIVSEVAAMQRMVLGSDGLNQVDQYFKFVCNPTDEDFAEVARAMSEYYTAGIPTDIEVFIMPASCTEEQQQAIAPQVAKMCIDHGYTYCHRVHNSVFGNGVGT
jgi:organic radical activating enzyme